MSSWRRFHASIYDRMCAAKERAFLEHLRHEIVGRASGTVLEVGAGTGLNFAHYRATDVDRLLAVEPDRFMRDRAEAKAASEGLAIQFVAASGECLPLASGCADSVVATLVLCSVDDPERAAGELHRVVKPEGALLFIEHVRSEEPWRASLQHWVTPVWRRLAANCHVDRSTLSVLRRVGFEVQEIERVPRGGPWGNPIVAGLARRASLRR